MLRHKCLDVLWKYAGGIRSSPLALSRQPGDWNKKTNKAPCASSQMQINPRRESDGDFCCRKFSYRLLYKNVGIIKAQSLSVFGCNSLRFGFLFFYFYVYLE